MFVGHLLLVKPECSPVVLGVVLGLELGVVSQTAAHLLSLTPAYWLRGCQLVRQPR